MTETQHRPVRSFVLRQGRMSKGQTRAYETLMPKFAVPYSVAPLDLALLFGRAAPKILEIGFGMGDSTAKIAQSHPENDYLCIEVHTPGVGSLLKYIDEMGLTNIRIIQHDAVEVMQHMLAPETLDGVHIFFPDPWHKKRHHKRRLIQAAFIALICDRLKPGGYLHAATDWEEYAAHILDTFRDELRLVNSVSDYAPRPEYRPLTKFEQRGLRLGHGVWDVIFRKA
ncbi:MAG: tRNA (guanosine(46)-N7)-methyltransferase TrmB [Sulfurimicrobium sp.]|jgi:tRNA (guanine-N7-)-methyltransferase|nr:tRNA (guanosine(46)-N7)-methyltransferase TrmB [Sulfurimicrobium sp.]MDZ7656922.1 tRNA (guanosine(46)-N7)-methyltransferase TrmB [Sulfurimicrobium sp.]